MNEKLKKQAPARSKTEHPAPDGVRLLDEALRHIQALRPAFEMRVSDEKGLLAPVQLPKR